MLEINSSTKSTLAIKTYMWHEWRTPPHYHITTTAFQLPATHRPPTTTTTTGPSTDFYTEPPQQPRHEPCPATYPHHPTEAGAMSSRTYPPPPRPPTNWRGNRPWFFSRICGVFYGICNSLTFYYFLCSLYVLITTLSSPSDGVSGVGGEYRGHFVRKKSHMTFKKAPF